MIDDDMMIMERRPDSAGRNSSPDFQFRLGGTRLYNVCENSRGCVKVVQFGSTRAGQTSLTQPCE